jgi:uncharacterized membrane protein
MKPSVSYPASAVVLLSVVCFVSSTLFSESNLNQITELMSSMVFPCSVIIFLYQRGNSSERSYGIETLPAHFCGANYQN